MKILSTFLAAVTLAGLGTGTGLAQKLDLSKPLEKVTFGSCSRQDRDMSIYKVIEEEESDLFLFLGDNIYGDTEDMKVLQEKYDLFGSREEFASLRKKVPMLAVWDDHDYGLNDAGKEYKKKKESEKIFLDFWGVPENTPERDRPGTYGARMIGPEGKRVNVILLDTRYFRDALEKKEKRDKLGTYQPTQDEKKTILGDAQWKWLEAELRKPAEFRLICTSIQFLSQDHDWESWSNFPHERQRMLDLLRETKAGGTIFLSGDRHLSELAELSHKAEGSPGWHVLEVTSSGLTHAGGGQDDEPNRHRIKGGNYRGKNYGSIEFDWEKPSCRLLIHGEEGQEVLRFVSPLRRITPRLEE